MKNEMREGFERRRHQQPQTLRARGEERGGEEERREEERREEERREEERRERGRICLFSMTLYGGGGGGGGGGIWTSNE